MSLKKNHTEKGHTASPSERFITLRPCCLTDGTCHSGLISAGVASSEQRAPGRSHRGFTPASWRNLASRERLSSRADPTLRLPFLLGGGPTGLCVPFSREEVLPGSRRPAVGHCPLHLPGQDPGLSELEEISVSSTPTHGETEAQGVEGFARSHPACRGESGLCRRKDEASSLARLLTGCATLHSPHRVRPRRGLREYPACPAPCLAQTEGPTLAVAPPLAAMSPDFPIRRAAH